MIEYQLNVSEFISLLKEISDLSFTVQISFGRTPHVRIVGRTFIILLTPIFDFVEEKPYCVMVSEYTHLCNSVTEYGVPLFQEIQHLATEAVYVLQKEINK